MNFLQNLDLLLARNGINKSELAKAINISPGTITAWYNGNYENISLSILLKITKYFNVTLEELVNGDGESITFSADNFSTSELKAIRNFSNFLIENRSEVLVNHNIKTFENLKNDTKEYRKEYKNA